MLPGDAPSRWPGSRSALATAILLPAVLAGLILALLPHEVFWITDGGNRLIQVEDLDRFGAGDLAVAYPARPLDPELRFFPFASLHFLPIAGRVFSFYPPYFPLLSLPGYRLLGPAGLYLLPWLGLVLVLAGFAALLGEIGLAPWRAPATLGFALGTPILFYGLTFWEHTLSAALATAAVLLLLRAGQRLPGALAAGLLLGLSTALREEGYVLAAALGLATLVSRWWLDAPARTGRPPISSWATQPASSPDTVPLAWNRLVPAASSSERGHAAAADFLGRRLSPAAGFSGRRLATAAGFSGRRLATAAGLGLGWVAAMAPVWWFQRRLYGSVLGLHAAAYGGLSQEHEPARLFGELGDLAFYLFRFHSDLRWNAALVVPFVLLLAVGLLSRRGAGRLEPALLWLSAATAALLVARLLADPEPVFGTLWTQGLLPHTPLLLLILARLRALLGSPRPAVRLLAWTCVLYALLLAVPLHRAAVGIIWGPRHFLAVYPLLAALALVALRDALHGASQDAMNKTPAGDPATEEASPTAAGGEAAAPAALLVAETPRRPALRTGLAGAAGVAGAAAVLFLLGVAVEVQGIRLLALKKEATRGILQAVRETPSRVVVTDAFWLPEELGALWFEKAFLFVGSDADYREIMARLARRGPAEVTVVLARRNGSLGPASLLDLRGRARSARPVATPGVGFLDVMVLSCRTR